MAQPPAEESRERAFQLILAEYDAMRTSMNQSWNLIGQLVGVPLVLAGVTITITVKADARQAVDVYLGAALVANGVAWTVLLQCFRILWKTRYIVRELRPAIAPLISASHLPETALGWSEFGLRATSWDTKLAALLCALFAVLLVITPSLGFLGAACWSASALMLTWTPYEIALLAVGAVSSLLMAVTVIAGAAGTIDLAQRKRGAGPP